MFSGTHLGDAALPAHPPEARGRQDDGGEVLLLVQLLQTRVEVPALGRERSGKTPRGISPPPKTRFKDTMSLKSRWGNLFFSWAARRSELVPITLHKHSV